MYKFDGQGLDIAGNPARLHEREYIEIINVVYREDKPPPCTRGNTHTTAHRNAAARNKRIPRRLRTVHVRHAFETPPPKKASFAQTAKQLSNVVKATEIQRQEDDSNSGKLRKGKKTKGVQKMEWYSSIRNSCVNDTSSLHLSDSDSEQLSRRYEFKKHEAETSNRFSASRKRSGTTRLVDTLPGSANKNRTVHLPCINSAQQQRQQQQQSNQGKETNNVKLPPIAQKTTQKPLKERSKCSDTPIYLPPVCRNNRTTNTTKDEEQPLHTKSRKTPVIKNYMKTDNISNSDSDDISEMSDVHTPRKKKEQELLKGPTVFQGFNCDCHVKYLKKAVDWQKLIEEYREEILQLRDALRRQNDANTRYANKEARERDEKRGIDDVLRSHRSTSHRLQKIRTEEKIKHEHRLFQRLATKFWSQSKLSKAKEKLRTTYTIQRHSTPLPNDQSDSNSTKSNTKSQREECSPELEISSDSSLYSDSDYETENTRYKHTKRNLRYTRKDVVSTIQSIEYSDKSNHDLHNKSCDPREDDSQFISNRCSNCSTFINAMATEKNAKETEGQSIPFHEQTSMESNKKLSDERSSYSSGDCTPSETEAIDKQEVLARNTRLASSRAGSRVANSAGSKSGTKRHEPTANRKPATKPVSKLAQIYAQPRINTCGIALNKREFQDWQNPTPWDASTRIENGQKV